MKPLKPPKPIKSGRSIVILAGALLLFADAGAHADLITLPPIQDTTLYETSDGGVGNGAGTAMFAGRNSQSANSIRRALLAFDVAAAIPVGSTIDGVSLTLFNDGANDDPQTVELKRLTRDWGEGASVAGGGQGSGAPAAPGDATWLHAFYNTEFWLNPGGDFAPTASAAALVGGAGAYTWTTTTALVADVQSFLDFPNTNHGWALVGNEAAASSAKRFATREATDPAVQPALTVEYTPIPEPGTVLGVGITLLCTCFGTRRARCSGCY